MPIHDVICQACGKSAEILVVGAETEITCPSCGSSQIRKQISPTSSLTGKTRQAYPGPGDTSCCGGTPSESGCAGPGSCCGRGM